VKGDGFIRGGKGTLGTTGDMVTGADDGGSGMTTVVDPPVPLGLSVNTGDGDLLLIILLHPLRRLRSPSRKV